MVPQGWQSIALPAFDCTSARAIHIPTIQQFEPKIFLQTQVLVNYCFVHNAYWLGFSFSPRWIVFMNTLLVCSLSALTSPPPQKNTQTSTCLVIKVTLEPFVFNEIKTNASIWACLYFIETVTFIFSFSFSLGMLQS